MLSQVVELIEKQQSFAITTHVRPDGDGVGSSLGLFWLLKSLGKEAYVVVRDPIPSAYSLLPGASDIVVSNSVSDDVDAVFVIECSDIDRPGLQNLDHFCSVNIDHHTTCENFGTVNWIDPTASAVGEMIYNLCKAIGGRITQEIAECLYLALVTDTGSFHFPNTTERTLKVASELLRVGVKPEHISHAVYNSYPWSRIELMRRVLNTVQRDDRGRVAYARQTLADEAASGAVDGDNHGFVNIPLAAKEVQASFLMREIAPDTFRVSFRSKGDINVAIIAEKFGGGGHKNASGCRLKGDWQNLEGTLISAVSEVVYSTAEVS